MLFKHTQKHRHMQGRWPHRLQELLYIHVWFAIVVFYYYYYYCYNDMWYVIRIASSHHPRSIVPANKNEFNEKECDNNERRNNRTLCWYRFISIVIHFVLFWLLPKSCWRCVSSISCIFILRWYTYIYMNASE